MRSIFICYRRDDAEGEAGRLFDDLTGVFGEHSVFMDVAAIQMGIDFRKAIDESMATCGVLLGIIGRQWVEAKDETGQRRLDNPSDFVRLEIASALKRDIPVVPVLVQGAKIPRADQLPDDLKELTYRSGIELTGPKWHSDVQVLTNALRSFVEEPKAEPPHRTGGGTAAEPAPKPVKREVELEPSPRPSWKVWLALGATAIAVVAVGFLIYSLLRVTVPNVIGTGLSDATGKLQAAHLSLGRKTYQQAAAKGSDIVLSQSPAPNSKARRGSPVDVVLSQQPQIPKMVKVPNVVGKSLYAARQALEDRQLAVGNIERETRTDKPPNVVLDVSPSVGEQVRIGSTIDLKVSETASAENRGPKPPPIVSVPNLIGRSFDDARKLLQTSGLTVGSATEQSQAGVSPGTVLNQSPSSGQQVQKGTRVDVTVAVQLRPTLPIKVDAYSNPQAISPGGQAEIIVIARDPDGAVIPGATVMVQARGGNFSGSTTDSERGNTDSSGVYRTFWRAPAPAARGYVVGVKVTKEGYTVGNGSLRVAINIPEASGPFTGTYAEIYPAASGANYVVSQCRNEIHTSLSGAETVPLINDHEARVNIADGVAVFRLEGSILIYEIWAGGVIRYTAKFRKVSDRGFPPGTPGACQ